MSGTRRCRMLPEGYICKGYGVYKVGRNGKKGLISRCWPKKATAEKFLDDMRMPVSRFVVGKCETVFRSRKWGKRKRK